MDEIVADMCFPDGIGVEQIHNLSTESSFVRQVCGLHVCPVSVGCCGTRTTVGFARWIFPGCRCHSNVYVCVCECVFVPCGLLWLRGLGAAAMTVHFCCCPMNPDGWIWG